MTSDKFTCSACGGEFVKGRSDEAANAEARENFGVEEASRREDMAVICDDCYSQMMERLPVDGWVKGRP